MTRLSANGNAVQTMQGAELSGQHPEFMNTIGIMCQAAMLRNRLHNIGLQTAALPRVPFVPEYIVAKEV
jgi:hypothetical protein